MRLTQEEIDSIKTVFIEMFDKGSIYIFGSRVDDNAKGGDIDIFLKIDNIDDYEIVIKTIRKFKLKHYKKIEEKKIDIAISNLCDKYIEEEVFKKGVLIYEK